MSRTAISPTRIEDSFRSTGFNAGHLADSEAFLAEMAAFDAAEQKAAERQMQMARIAAEQAQEFDARADFAAAVRFGFQMA